MYINIQVSSWWQMNCCQKNALYKFHKFQDRCASIWYLFLRFSVKTASVIITHKLAVESNPTGATSSSSSRPFNSKTSAIIWAFSDSRKIRNLAIECPFLQTERALYLTVILCRFLGRVPKSVGRKRKRFGTERNGTISFDTTSAFFLRICFRTDNCWRLIKVLAPCWKFSEFFAPAGYSGSSGYVFGKFRKIICGAFQMWKRSIVCYTSNVFTGFIFDPHFPQKSAMYMIHFNSRNVRENWQFIWIKLEGEWPKCYKMELKLL